MVSEDSNPCQPALPPIHRLRNLRDGFQSFSSKVEIISHHADTVSKLLKLFPFSGAKRIRLEERDNKIEKVTALADDIAVQGFTMVIVPPIAYQLPYSKEGF